MKVELFVTGIISTNCYVAVNEETKQAVVIDPASASMRMMNQIREEGLKIEAILLTHGHFDHIMGIDGFLKEYQVPVYVHEDDLPMMEDPQWNQSSIYTRGYTFSGAVPVKDGQVLSYAGYDFRCCIRRDIRRAAVVTMWLRNMCFSAGIRCFRGASEGRILRAAVPRP